MRFFSRFILVLFLFLSSSAFADKLEKGFEKLKAFDYFSAKQYFEKSLDDDIAAAAFGLSVIYSTNNNPFYNSDSARRYILIADSVLPKLKEKIKKYYSTFGVTDSTIKSLSEYICEGAFNEAKKINSVEAYNHYISYFNSCSESDSAISLRNETAYNNSLAANTSEAFKNFMALYPQAEEYIQAQNKYDELVYHENTDGSIESYEYFIQNYPESPFRQQSEKMIYSLSVPDKKLEQYVAFVRKYKNSKFKDDAWREIYKLSMIDFTEASFAKFKSSYPDYPFPEELDNDFRLQNYFFLPFVVNNKWGYLNEEGEIMIRPSFDEATLFAEGLAVVSKNDKYGFINKAGKQVIDFQFQDAESFHNSAAVVLKDSLYGLINKTGEFRIPAKYQELSEVSDDLYMAVENDHSAYIDKNGNQLTGFVFDVANDFNNGYAIVSKDEKFGLVDSTGQFKLKTNFEDLVFIGDGLLKAMNDDDQWGIINIHGDTVLSFLFDAIAEFSEDRALIAKNEKCGYVNSSGAIVIPLTFSFSELMLTTAQFKNGLALLKQKTKSTLIDSLGKAKTFAGVSDYGRPSQGFVPVKKNKKWGFSDMTGKIIIPCQFESVDSFEQGFAEIRQNKLAGLIDSTGNIFISPLYEDIIVKENGLFVKSKGKNGLLSREGTLLVPCSYDKIELLSPLVARASNASVFTYINLKTGKIIFNSSMN